MAEERHLYTVLSNLKSSREETKGALQATTVSLIHDHNKGRITDILQSGLLHSLVGLIRCTTDADILYIALQLLSVLTHGSDEMRLEIARMKIVSVLLPLLTPPQEKVQYNVHYLLGWHAVRGARASKMKVWRYIVNVLEDAKLYSEYANKTEIDESDVRLAIQNRLDHSFTAPPPRELLVRRMRRHSQLFWRSSGHVFPQSDIV
ncbi:PREDICTED: uncharacterized protein LOC109585113 [Amphimedon queenslandica]|uniref:Uncharacterized protein n=2 Tax=Amphimedon queenslandica TaxID=400682 RepID=A0AAN0JIJ2_AMPQE|nr:PREDICTED: uncharacterized protein LOC109585113 [Amphimedon queenslandica]|eukprot:XP_019856621.1 PREDICTED: uncharacterized protein LOC109585113 [Amphimedon queenslandica]